MFEWTLPDGTVVHDGDEVEIDYSNPEWSQHYKNSAVRAFYSPRYTNSYINYNSMTIRYESYNYNGEDPKNNCHSMRLDRLKKVYGSVQYTPEQQADTEDDL